MYVIAFFITCFDAPWECNKDSHQYDDEVMCIHFQHPKQTTQFKADYNRLVLLPRDAMLAWYVVIVCPTVLRSSVRLSVCDKMTKPMITQTIRPGNNAQGL